MLGDRVKGGRGTTAGVRVAEALDLNGGAVPTPPFLVVRDTLVAAMGDGAVAPGDQIGVGKTGRRSAANFYELVCPARFAERS